MSRASRRSFLAGGGMLAAAGGLGAAPAAMPMRTLGKTGMKVTVLGFGCMTTSDPSVIEQGVEAGINYFDTARGYQNGQNERMVGAALKPHRNKIFLSSKTPAKTKADALANIDTTLKELGTDHIDIWYLHSRSTPEAVPDELFDAQDEAVKAGKVRFKGVSFHSGLQKMIPFLIEKKRTDVILTSYNFTMEPWMDELIDAAANAGIGIVAMKVMAGGFRSNKPGTPMAERLSRQGAMAAALKWAVRRPNIHTSIPGIMDLDQLDENFKAVSAGWKADDSKVLAAQLKVDFPAVLPDLRHLCGELRTGSAGKRRAANSELLGRLRRVRAGAGALAGAAGNAAASEMLRLQPLRHRLSERSSRARACFAGAGAVGVTALVILALFGGNPGLHHQSGVRATGEIVRVRHRDALRLHQRQLRGVLSLQLQEDAGDDLRQARLEDGDRHQRVSDTGTGLWNVHRKRRPAHSPRGHRSGRAGGALQGDIRQGCVLR